MKATFLVLTILALVASPLRAQQPPHAPQHQAQMPMHAPQPPHDLLMAHVFPPELVMQHQSAIGLQESQRTSILGEMQKAHAKFTEAQWRLHSESEKLQQLLQARRVDEAAVLTQVDRILDLEREIKKTHLGLLIRVKNTLTAEQQEKLANLRMPARP
ncbi:MAG: hypothetical protein HY561_11925 [Gemmatimonadetes bacterium]|nr:hypothetical protein [Gemmatimonadota bacterium]